MDDSWDAIERLSRQVHAQPDLIPTLGEVLSAADGMVKVVLKP